MSVSAGTPEFSQMVLDVVSSMSLEIAMFVAAVPGYLLIFSNRAPKDAQRWKLKEKQCQEATDDSVDWSEDPDPQNFESTDASLRRAAETSNHRVVLKLWNALKQFDQVPSARLPQIVESMQFGKKDGQFIVREVKAFFKKHPSECNLNVVNDILETLGKRLDSQLTGLIMEMLPSVDLKPNQRTYEILLTMHSTTRNFPDVHRLVNEMSENKVEPTVQATLAVIKSAMQAGNFDVACQQLSNIKATWATEDPGKRSDWPVPRHIMAQFVEQACRARQLQQCVPMFESIPLPEESFNEMLSESIRLNDSELARSIETMARAHHEPLPDSTYALLIKGLAGRPWRMKAVVQEALGREPAVFSPDLAFSVLSFCSKTSDQNVADTLLERMKPTQVNVLTAFIRFYLESEQLQKACDVFEQYVQPLGENASQNRLMIDSRVERSLMSAALQCGRTAMVQRLFDPSRADVAKHIVMIRKCAAENNLKGAMSIFNSLKEGGAEMNNIVYNTVLDACVKCNDLRAAEDWMSKTTEAGMVDVVSFNTLIKAHLAHSNLSKAREMMEQMKKTGLQPNRVTYNEILNAVVVLGSRRSDIWEVVKEMKEASIPPNQVTCSILLKTLNGKSSETDILLTMDLIEALDEPMDEVLLSSVVEACVRIGKPDLLVSKLEALQGKDRIALNGSHTSGSLIKAYGHAKDLQGVWRVWKDMRSKLIKPTSITLGCMVEAVVNNGDTEGAFELIHQIQQDEQCRDAVNAVIYCSLLKGFSRERKLDRVWEVYKEMSAKSVEMSLITFNTIIDACARAGRMDELPKVMQDMKKHHVEPNLITYSTILKGHCQAGDIQCGFSVLQDMKRDTNLKPDEIMYNSLLDGCAQNNLYEEGVSLLEEMQKEGIAPSNFTLSIMVKLLNRSRRVEQAFDLVRDLPKKYKFKPNAHVYTNLMQACIGNRQPQRALTVLESMVKDRVQPDCRVYGVLIRSSFYQDKTEQADALFRAALGLPGAFAIPGLSLASCVSFDYNFANEVLTSFVERGCAQSVAAPLLADIKKSKAKVSIDLGLQRRISMSVGEEPQPYSRVSPKGKGRGQKGSW